MTDVINIKHETYEINRVFRKQIFLVKKSIFLLQFLMKTVLKRF